MSELWQAAQSNLGFVLVCIGIIAILILLAKLSERFWVPVRKVSTARRVSIIGICSALAAVLMLLEFPLLFLAPEFYKLDFSEVPVMLCGFYLGPSAAIISELLKVLLKLFIKGTTTAFIGDFANFVVGCLLVLPAVVIYHTKKSKASAFWGLTTGTASLTLFGSLFNAVYLLPTFARFYSMPLDDLIGTGTAVNGSIQSISSFVLLAVVPLNLIKGIFDSILTLLLYKRVVRPLFGK